MAPAQDPVDIEARDVDAEAAAFVGLDGGDDLAPAMEGIEPSPAPVGGEIADKTAIGVLDLDGGERNGIFDPGDRILLDDASADTPKEEQFGIDTPLQSFGKVGNAVADQFLGVDLGQRR